MKTAFSLVSKLIVIGCMVLTLATVLLYAYTSFYARPTGDDLGFSYRAHRTWEETSSVPEVLKATLEEIQFQREVWASDYTMVLLVSLMPEVFKPWTFWIACWFVLLMLVISVFAFSKEILINRFHFPGWFSWFFAGVVTLLILQEMPSTNSGMYWYTGAVHYPLAFSLALLFLVCASRYLRGSSKRNIFYMCLLAVLIGGDGFFASVFLVVSCFFIFVWGIVRKEKKVLNIGIPFVVLLICFVYTLTAEGPYKSRASADISISLSLVLETIWNSFARSVSIAFEWICKHFFIIPSSILLIFVCLYNIKWEKIDFRFEKPILVVCSLFITYASCFAPWVYSETFDKQGASIGPENYCFFTFVIFLLVSIVYVTGFIKKKMKKKSETGYLVGFAMLILCFACAFFNKHAIKETHGYVGTEYILSGQAEDYKDQCERNMEMLLDPAIKNVELIPTNSFQGLLCNMVATENPDDFTSAVYSQFYGKESVIMK